MAKEIINVGIGNNSGDGEPLRSAGIKINNNTSNLFSISGWGYYKDDETSSLTINTTDSLFQINGLHASTETSYLPLDIRGVSELWSSDKINAISIGDGYDVRLDFNISAKTGSPTYIDLSFDIGGGATPSTVIINRTISLIKTPPYNISIAFPLFSLSTFVTNGGQFFIKTDSGTVTIDSRAILIKRDFKNI